MIRAIVKNKEDSVTSKNIILKFLHKKDQSVEEHLKLVLERWRGVAQDLTLEKQKLEWTTLYSQKMLRYKAFLTLKNNYYYTNLIKTVRSNTSLHSIELVHLQDHLRQ